MKQTSLRAFTLVELIVVITILAILGTIGFISFQGYTVSARDTVRISDVNIVDKALSLYSTRNQTLPLPDNAVTLTSGSDIIGYQGDLGSEVLRELRQAGEVLDPLTQTPYSYMINTARSSYQLLAFMERTAYNFIENPLTTQTFANIYQTRFPRSFGARLGIMTDSNNTPIQDLSLPGDTLDIADVGSLNLKSFLNDTEYVEGTTTSFTDLPNILASQGIGWTVESNAFVYTGTEVISGGSGGGTPPAPSNRYPGCDTDDITLGGFTIAACNVGSAVAGTTSASYGRFFQWGENIAWDASSGTASSNNCTWDRDTQACTTPSLSAWSSTVSDTTSGGADRWFDYGDTRGPCAPGYRVPSVTDWQNLVSAGGWGTTQQGAAMQTYLKLPFEGYRRNGTLNDGGNIGYYWSSSPSGSSAHYLYFDSFSISPADSSSRSFGFSVRCFKN